MSYSTDLHTLMHGDPSVNSWIDGGIHYENLPENFEITKSWIVYSFNKTTNEVCLGSHSAFMKYNLLVKVIAQDTVELETISDRLVAYLSGNEQGGIKDLLFMNDNHSLDLDKNLYMNTLNFDTWFV